MNELKGREGELKFTVTIKRKDTGLEETYDLVGKVTGEQAAELGIDQLSLGDTGTHEE